MVEIKEVYIFPMGNSPKVNAITWLKFELAYDDVSVQDFSHYTTVTHTLYTFVQCFNALMLGIE